MQHVFSHQNPYHQPDWHHQQSHQQHAQAQAAAAAAAAAQQQHYGRIAQHSNNAANNNLNNGGGPGSHSGAGHPGGGLDHGQNGGFIGAGGDQGVSEENRRVLEWIGQVLRAETRESALLELSKKREQVPELALILWHSFGMAYHPAEGQARMLTIHANRRHDFTSSGDHISLPAAEPVPAHRRSFESRMQCPSFAPVRRFSQ